MKKEMQNENENSINKLFSSEEDAGTRYEEDHYEDELNPAAFFGIKRTTPENFEAPKDPAFFTVYTPPAGAAPKPEKTAEPEAVEEVKPEPTTEEIFAEKFSRRNLLDDPEEAIDPAPDFKIDRITFPEEIINPDNVPLAEDSIFNTVPEEVPAPEVKPEPVAEAAPAATAEDWLDDEWYTDEELPASERKASVNQLFSDDEEEEPVDTYNKNDRYEDFDEEYDEPYDDYEDDYEIEYDEPYEDEYDDYDEYDDDDDYDEDEYVSRRKGKPKKERRSSRLVILMFIIFVLIILIAVALFVLK